MGFKKLNYKKRKRKKNGRRKKNSTELQKPNIDAEVYNNNKNCDWIYIYTDTPISKIKIVQQKYSTVDWPGKQRKPKVISTSLKKKNPN